MLEFDHRKMAVKKAKWTDILKFVLTKGRHGKLYDIVDLSKLPPMHLSCRCSTSVNASDLRKKDCPIKPSVKYRVNER